MALLHTIIIVNKRLIMTQEIKKNAASGATGDKKRNTYFFHPETTKKVKYIALMEDKTQTEVINEALNDFIAKYEKTHGKIKLGG